MKRKGKREKKQGPNTNVFGYATEKKRGKGNKKEITKNEKLKGERGGRQS